MEVLLVLSAGVLLVGSVLGLSKLIALSVDGAIRARKHRARAWEVAARELRFEVSRHKEEFRMQGVLNGIALRVALRAEPQRPGAQAATSAQLVFAAGGPGRIPHSLAIRADSVLRMTTQEDVELGDPAFDDLVEIPRIDAYGCAALTHAAREELKQLLKRGGELRQGTLSLHVLGSLELEADWLVKTCRFLADLGQRLSVTPDTLHERLAQNAVHDPFGAVRLQNLRFLADPALQTPPELLASAAHALLSDPHVGVRLLAAQQLPALGRPVLLEIVKDAAQPLEFRVDALRGLGAVGVSDPGELLSELLSVPEPALVCTALELVGSLGLTQLLPQVLQCALSERESVRAAAATALGQLPAELAEQPLIERLEDRSVEVKLASAEALGRIGSVRAVEPLLPLTEGVGRAQLRQVARAAIGRIQSRLGHAELGALSLAEELELAGALELATGPAAARVGELSMASEEAVAEEAVAEEAVAEEAVAEEAVAAEAETEADDAARYPQRSQKL